MGFSPERYLEHCEEYRSQWQHADQILYGIARPHCGPCTSAEANAKLLIIGRSYATGIERLIPNDGSNAISCLSAFFEDNRRRVDSLVSQLDGVKEPLRPEKLKKILCVHGDFVCLLKQLTRGGAAPRSFASKYLHFHCPAVPIYDAVAAQELTCLYPWRRNPEVFEPPSQADPEYARFVSRFWRLYRDALKAVSPVGQVTVKLLDYYLWFANSVDGGQPR